MVESASADNYQCPVCYLLMVEPVKFSCGHYFCFICTSNLQRNQCPMCRAIIPENYNPTIDLELQKKISQKFPVQFSKMKNLLIKEKKLEAMKVKLKFFYGNSHQIVHKNKDSDNKHRWTMYFRMANKSDDISKYVKKVVFGLHPSFGWTERTFQSPPYEMSYVGWGTFEIPITIHWKPQLTREVTQLSHYLCFEGNGKKSSIVITFDKDRVKKL